MADDVVNVNANDLYIPEANGNRDAEKPIRMKIQLLTIEDQQECDYFEYIGGKLSKMRLKANWVEIFRRGVVSIENAPDGADTPDKWLKVRGKKWMSDMVTEVGYHIKQLHEGDLKN